MSATKPVPTSTARPSIFDLPAADHPPERLNGYAGNDENNNEEAIASVALSMPLYSVYTECVFEWDPRKAEANAAKHGLTFDEAVTVFLDPDALDGPDLQHSAAEARFRRLGRSADGRVLIVAYTLRRSGDAEAIRLISARRASRRERAAYTPKD